ncbi:MAG: hypothetical protein MHM6MM_009631 [Cercozoa sp. M6MM]
MIKGDMREIMVANAREEQKKLQGAHWQDQSADAVADHQFFRPRSRRATLSTPTSGRLGCRRLPTPSLCRTLNWLQLAATQPTRRSARIARKNLLPTQTLPDDAVPHENVESPPGYSFDSDFDVEGGDMYDSDDFLVNTAMATDLRLTRSI